MKDRAMYICNLQWAPKKTFYVSGHPHRKGTRAALRHGVDWGYETHPSKARPINAYWKRRFESDMRHVGAVGVNCRKIS